MILLLNYTINPIKHGKYMTFDFDSVINRNDTGSIKFDLYKNRDIIPMWVADMDFSAPLEVLEAVSSRVEHGVFGYTIPQKQLKELIVERMSNLYNWEIKPEWLVFTAGLVSGLNCICRALCQPGQEVTVFSPIYPPFLEIPEVNYCELSNIPMLNNSEYYTIDFDRFENSLSDKSGMLMLSNPHNPSGRVHSKEELAKLAEICNRHGLPIVSDEIHCELMLGDSKHTPIATLDDKTLNNSITLMSPSKTFNIAGLMCGFAIIPNLTMREQVKSVVNKMSSHPNTLGYEGAFAAYKYGEPWRRELLKYLTANRDLIYAELSDIPQLKLGLPESTYLYWIDCRGLGEPNPAKYFEKYGVGLNNGEDFDAPGYVRLNFGCPRSVLIEALQRIKSAIK